MEGEYKDCNIEIEEVYWYYLISISIFGCWICIICGLCIEREKRKKRLLITDSKNDDIETDGHTGVSVASPLYFILHKFFGDRGNGVMEDSEANNNSNS